MIVERQNNEILVRFSAGTDPSKIQSILDYLKYLEITSKSNAKKKDLDVLIKEAKKGRLDKFKKETGLDG